MATRTPLTAESNTAQGQIQIVVDDNKIVRAAVIFVKQISNRCSAAIHERLRFGQNNSLAVDTPLTIKASSRLWLSFRPFR